MSPETPAPRTSTSHVPSSAAGAVPAPDTVVLIHGFWVTPRSWEQWIAHYEHKGYRVIAPAYPGSGRR